MSTPDLAARSTGAGPARRLQSQLLTYITVQTQVNEMQLVREKVYAMEQTHMALKQK